MKLSTLLAHFWILGILAPCIRTEEEKCLGLPDIHPKKYAFLNDEPLNITLQVSERVTHKLITHIFYIFLKEVVGYAKVNFLPGEDYFSVEYTLDQMVAYHNSSVPKAMMNLEVWIPPDFDTLNMELIKECGSVIPSGRFGWFIPTALDAPIRKAYKHWSDDIREIHWSFFRDENNVKAFDLDKETLAKMDVEFAINKETKKYYCNEIYCTNGMYIPEQCKDKSCAVILTSNFNSTKFVVDDINEMKLYVKVYWLGNSLKNAIKYLTNEYETNPKKTKSIIILNWTPSDIILNETNYINVAFKNCERFSRRNDSKCKYEMHRLVKFAWKKVETIAESLYQALRRFELDQGDFNHLIKLYELYGDNKTVHQIACEWMKTRNATWKSWQSAIRPKLDIGGIFPISKSSYSGKEIMSAAWLAKNSINENQTILPDYDINLIVTDGECNAATVMKNFIDFIREETYQSLVGVLGPACSDTVEPLAGVSKHFRVMVISYSAEGASFSNREKYPYFFRTIGENKHYKHVYLDLFKKMGWKRVAALTEDGQKYTEYISLMQDEFDKNNIKFISNKKFPRERETDAMTRYLEDLKSKRARIIIADVVEEVARSVMCEAYRLKMTSAQGYVWFLPMRLNSPWYDTDYFNKNHKESVNCTTAQMIKAITGYFAMTHAFFAQDNEIMQENKTVGEWRREHVNISNYGSFAYDAVWTYALALDKLSKTDPEALSNIHSLNTTNKLVRLVEQTDFHGVSGRIKFRGGPSRFSVINLLEWYDNEMHVIGHFYPNLTDDQPEIFGGNLILNQTAIKWFTEDRKPPDDGTTDADCAIQGFAKFFNVGCQTAVIILNLICGAILCIIVTVVCLVMKRKYDRKVQEAQKRMMNSWGIPFDSNGQNDLDKWEVPRENVVINRKLGEGAFGMVYGGEANFPDSGWVAIAVKTLKMGSTTEEKLDFLSEADIMKRFDHKNIVRLLGVCTKEEPVYTIMEFMLYGDLKTFLLARRHLVNKSFDDNGEVSCKRLTSMALDVARALSYLAEMKYVHRDIASRNCLVNASRTVKLGDFGMTRANDYYKFNRKGMLPVRWMSPESLALGVFTPASDVWSYGVLLYEIITFGSFPFQGISNLQVLDLVKNGQTLDIPQGVKPQLEGLIKSCWQLDSKDRPPASQIVDFLANNPKLLAPCLDVPLSSVQLEDTDQLEVHLPNEFRKCSTASFKSSPTLLVNNGTTLSASIEKNTGKQLSSSAATSTLKAQRQPDSGISIPLENCCPKEPLLGTARSMSSILNFNKYAMHYKDADDDEDDFIGQSPPNGHVVTKV